MNVLNALTYNNSVVPSIENSHFAGSVSSSAPLDGYFKSAGLVFHARNARIVNSINSGDISGGNSRAGIIGVASDGVEVRNIVSMGSISAGGHSMFEHFNGNSEAVTNNLITVTDLVGENISHTSGVIELSSSSINQATFETYGFDFTNDWEMVDGEPHLQAIPLVPLIQAPSIGSGTEVNPYQISTLAELIWITRNSDSWDKYFVLTANIDALISSEIDHNNDEVLDGLFLVGNSTTAFSGNFDGGGFTIENLTVDNSTGGNDGIFVFLVPMP